MTDFKIKRIFWGIGNFYRYRLQILANLSGKHFGWNGSEIQASVKTIPFISKSIMLNYDPEGRRGGEPGPRSTPNMTGRPGCRTMEMNAGSSSSYLARTPCVPCFVLRFFWGGNRRPCRLPREGGDVGGKEGSICHFVFPLFYSVSGSQDAQILGKNSTKSVTVTPLFVRPQMLVKTRT